MLQRKKLSTTIGKSNYDYLHNMVKAGRAESVGAAVDRTVEIARRLDSRATLERQTAAYFKGLTSEARVDSVLIVPFCSQGVDGPTTLRFDPGETGLPRPSWLKGHFITTLKKSLLGKRLPRPLSALRMRQVSLAIQRAFDPDSPPRKA